MFCFHDSFDKLVEHWARIINSINLSRELHSAGLSIQTKKIHKILFQNALCTKTYIQTSRDPSYSSSACLSIPIPNKLKPFLFLLCLSVYPLTPPTKHNSQTSSGRVLLPHEWGPGCDVDLKMLLEWGQGLITSCDADCYQRGKKSITWGHIHQVSSPFNIYCNKQM